MSVQYSFISVQMQGKKSCNSQFNSLSNHIIPVSIYLQTLMRSYLLKIDGKVAERPQHMLMRVAIGIHQNDIKAACETYRLMSEKWFTHASPTLFNAGTCRPQMSSCFLLTMSDDSIDGIYETLSTCAKISKAAGGIGLNVHNIRASGSYIAGVRCWFLDLTLSLKRVSKLQFIYNIIVNIKTHK